MDTNQIPGSQDGPEDGSEVRRLLDDAARAYMDGDYAAAVASWQEVLVADPSNPRAREGIKKVAMLQAGDRADLQPPKDPAVEEVEELLLRRRFEEALELCRDRSEVAGPGLRKALRELQEQAERARAVEPEIQRCMASARRALQAGNVQEALPHLKQVLTLDRSHPVASRLMSGLRERVRRRDDVDAPAGAEDERAALPASGRPGSDAPVEDADDGTALSDPAPLGKGLPSSPVGAGPDPSAPEIELDMVSLDDMGPAAPEAEAVSGEDEPLRTEDGEELVADAPLSIPLQTGEEPEAGPDPSPSQAGRQGVAISHASESPFGGGDDEGQAGAAAGRATGHRKSDDGEEDAGARLRSAPSLPAASGPGSFLDEDEADEEEAHAPAPSARRGRSSRRSRSGAGSRPGVVWGGLAAVLILGAGAAAWQLGLIPGIGGDSEPVPPAPVPAAAADPATGDEAPPAGEPVESAAAAVAVPEPAPEAARNPRQALVLLEEGQDHFQAGRYEEAGAAFRQASELDPVNPEIALWQSKLDRRQQQDRRQQGEYEQAVSAFRDKDFETALRKFYRLREGGGERPYDTYIANSWYNWGLQMLAAGNLREADRKMDEVLGIDPQDADAPAIKKLVGDYQKRAKDRAFYLQIESLRYRPLDG